MVKSGLESDFFKFRPTLSRRDWAGPIALRLDLDFIYFSNYYKFEINS